MKNILLVDDEPHMIRLLRFALSKVPGELVDAASGEEALVLFDPATIGLVILDFSMPDLSGVETLRRLREMPGGSTVPVFMLTARDQTAIRQEAAGLDVAEFLTKPFSPSDLARKAGAALEGAG